MRGHHARLVPWYVLCGAGLVALLAGCAPVSLPPARAVKPGDLRVLGGKWMETRGRGLDAIGGTYTVEGGKIRFETATATGVLTLHEGEKTRILRGEGVRKAGGDAFAIELTQIKE